MLRCLERSVNLRMPLGSPSYMSEKAFCLVYAVFLLGLVRHLRWFCGGSSKSDHTFTMTFGHPLP